jgi:hypothetical protein
MTTPPTIPRFIRHDSLELVCLHEAGHVVAALMAGARVVLVEGHADSPPCARLRCDDDAMRRQKIAVGGHAVEWRLLHDKRLVDAAGGPLGVKAFRKTAREHAKADQLMHGGTGLEFLVDAQNLQPLLDYDLVERFATAFLEKPRLEESKILAIWDTRRKT